MRVQWAEHSPNGGRSVEDRHFPVHASVKRVAPWHLFRKVQSANKEHKTDMQDSIAKQDARPKDFVRRSQKISRHFMRREILARSLFLADEILRKHATTIYPAACP